MFYNRALRKQKLLRDEINFIEAKLKDFPDGSFTCQKNGNTFRWRVTYGKFQYCIPKEDRKKAELFAHKKYLTCRLSRLKNEELAVKSYLKFYNRHVKTTDEDLLFHPEYQKLLAPFLGNTSLKKTKWMNAPFKKNQSHKEHLIHETASGIKTRSKSEQMIEAALRQYNLAYRYEEELVLGDEKYFPDFKIIHPRTGEIILWEHVGRTDKPKYMFRFISKFQDYLRYGYYPSINLILTFDTDKKPLSTDTIERIIEMYFDD